MTDQFKNPHTFISYSRLIDREWRSALSLLEYAALRFVLDRTVGWGKQWERITFDQCSEGVFSPDGKCHAGAFTTSRNRASEVIRSLVTRGALMVEPTSKGFDKAHRYAINPQWIPDMKIPKRLREPNKPISEICTPDQCTENRAFDSTENVAIERTPSGATKRRERIRGEKSIREPSPSRVSGTLQQPETISEAKAAFRVRERIIKTASASRPCQGYFARRANGSPSSGLVPNLGEVVILWKRLHKQHFGDEAMKPTTRGHLAALRQYARAWTLARDAGEFVDYLGWIFAEWPALRHLCFAWMPDCPLTPAIQIIVSSKLRWRIEVQHENNEAVKAWRLMDEHSRKVDRLVREKGMDPEQAEAIINRELGTGKEWRLIQEARARVQAAEQQLAQKETEMERREARAAARKNLNSKTLDNSTGTFTKWD